MYNKCKSNAGNVENVKLNVEKYFLVEACTSDILTIESYLPESRYPSMDKA
jgi:hypothetical protein